MRYSTLISTVLTVLTMSCTSLPTPVLSPGDCLSRSDCRLVIVDNTVNQSNVDVRINNVKLGEVTSYSTGVFTFYTTRLVHGNCAIATARFIGGPHTITSSEQCIEVNEYFNIKVTNHPDYIWLTPFRLQ